MYQTRFQTPPPFRVIGAMVLGSLMAGSLVVVPGLIWAVRLTQAHRFGGMLRT